MKFRHYFLLWRSYVVIPLSTVESFRHIGRQTDTNILIHLLTHKHRDCKKSKKKKKAELGTGSFGKSGYRFLRTNIRYGLIPTWNRFRQKETKLAPSTTRTVFCGHQCRQNGVCWREISLESRDVKNIFKKKKNVIAPCHSVAAPSFYYKYYNIYIIRLIIISLFPFSVNCWTI